MWPGAPMTAVMSYVAWQRDYDGDPSVVGSTFWVNTKAVTIIGIAPKGFYGDRLSSTPPDFYLPIESMPVHCECAVCARPGCAVAVHCRAREAGRPPLAPLQEKVSALAAAVLCSRPRRFPKAKARRLLPKAHVVLTPGGGGIQAHAAGVRLQPVSADDDLRRWCC